MTTGAHGRNRLARRFPAGPRVLAAVALVAAVAAAQSGSATARRSSSTPAVLATHARPTAGGTCPPNATYPTSPSDNTQYGVPFTANITDGTVNVGYNEDTGGPGTKPYTNMPYFPWVLHLTGLRGTVSGCVPLPGLSLAVQPSDVHINTYGYMQGPNNCTNSPSGCTLSPHKSATFSFTGIADPTQTTLPLFLAGNGLFASGATTVHFHTCQVRTPTQACTPNTPLTPPTGLKVTDPKFTTLYAYPSTGPPKAINLPAKNPPGAKLGTKVYAGSVTVTNTTPYTINSITGEESVGFVTGLSSLAPGQSSTYTFTFEGSSYGFLPNEDALPITFRGWGPYGMVSGSTVAYFTFPSVQITPLQVTGATINGQPAGTSPGPEVPAGSVFTGTVTLTNNSRSAVTGIIGETSQTAQLLVMVAPSGTQTPPIVLGGFSLVVSLPQPLTATVAGARPDSFGPSPLGALDSTAAATAFGAFSATNPPLACGEPVSTTVTTGSSTVVPVSPPGLPPHPNGPQWTMQGQPIAGTLASATAQLVSNSFPLKVPFNPPPGYTQQCGIFGELFNWEIGGVQPNGQYYNCPTCPGPQPSGPGDAGAPRGEAQTSIDVVLTSVGALPICRPSITTAVRCS